MDKILEDILLLKLKNNYCPMCGSQRCDFSEEWREGCKHWKNLVLDSLNPDTYIPVLYYDMNIMSLDLINEIGEWLYKRYPRLIILPLGTTLVNLTQEEAIEIVKELQVILEKVADETIENK